MKRKLILILIACSVSVSAFAEFLPDLKLYLGTAYYIHDDGRELDDAPSFEAGIELLTIDALSDAVSWEWWFSKYRADFGPNSTESEVKRLSQGLIFHLNGGETRTFITAGVGHQKIENGGDKDAETVFHLGTGIKTHLNPDWILRGELLLLRSGDLEETDYAARLSIGYVLTRLRVPEPFYEPDPEPIPEPEPAPAPKPAPVPEPEPEPIDTDMDGVFDPSDECPGTDIAFKVDAVGCPILLIETVSINMDVKFEFDSAELTPVSYPEVQKLADFMNQFDKTAVTIEGHTDHIGDNAYNKALSQNRAETVKNILISDLGIAEERVSAIGYGEENPTADNATPEGRAKNATTAGRAENRRVIAVVESTIESMTKKEN